jgi:hypothetical protein
MPPFEALSAACPICPLICRNRGGRDDDAALAILQWIDRAHLRRSEAHDVEAADQIDLDDPTERIERHRTVASDDAPGGPEIGAIDSNARRAVVLARCRKGGFHRSGVGYVRTDREPA